METLEAIRTRRSIRQFLPQPIEFEKIAAILDAAHQAPSAGNVQDWRFIVVTDRQKIRELPSHCANQQAANAPLVILVCSDTSFTEEHYGPRGKFYGIQNAAAATENLLLAAHALGLGAVWIGAFDEDGIKRLFFIPPNIAVQALICVGYPDELLGPKERKDLGGVVYFNQWSQRLRNVDFTKYEFGTLLKKKVAEARAPVGQGGRRPAAVARMGHHLRAIREQMRMRRHGKGKQKA